MVRNFKYAEFTKTSTGLNNDIPNDLRLLENLVDLARFLDKIRDELGMAIIVTSGYRSPEVNKAVNGATNSHHTMCLAADIKCQNMSKLEAILDKHINELDEYGKYYNSLDSRKKELLWFHVSIGPLKRRKQFTKYVG